MVSFLGLQPICKACKAVWPTLTQGKQVIAAEEGHPCVFSGQGQYLEHLLVVVLKDVQRLFDIPHVVQGNLQEVVLLGLASCRNLLGRNKISKWPTRELTVLSAEPVASTNSLKGLNPKQFTSALCASTESTTPARFRKALVKDGPW